MSGNLIGALVVLLATFQLAMALLYFRPKALRREAPSRYSLWKALSFLSLIALVLGILMLILPQQLWL